MEFDDSVAAPSSASSALIPPSSTPPPEPPEPKARGSPAYSGDAEGASELPRRTEIGGESATLPEAARAVVPAADGQTAAGTSEGGAGSEAVAAKPVFVDEEALFSMPELVEDMARGMLVPPPAIDWEEDEAEACLIDLSLWKH